MALIRLFFLFLSVCLIFISEEIKVCGFAASAAAVVGINTDQCARMPFGIIRHALVREETAVLHASDLLPLHIVIAIIEASPLMFRDYL